MELKKHSDKNEEPLTEHISFRVTPAEIKRYDIIAKANFISIHELVRNVMRQYSHEFVHDEKLRKKLRISNEIEYFFIKNQVISSRNESNFTKINEILNNFERNLETRSKKSNDSDLEYTFYQVSGLLDRIKEDDPFLFNLIEPNAKRIFKSKALKAFVSLLERKGI